MRSLHDRLIATENIPVYIHDSCYQFGIDHAYDFIIDKDKTFYK